MNALLFFEHTLLPHMIFSEPVQASILIPSDSAVLHKLCDDVYKQHGEENPYGADEFGAKGKKIDEKTFLLKITFPKPNSMPLCYHSYMVFNDDFTKVSYFCLEKTDEDDENAMLCEWTADGEHINYGLCNMKKDEASARCIEIFRTK